MMHVLEYIGIDGVMIVSIIVALSCLAYLITLTVREHALSRQRHHHS